PARSSDGRDGRAAARRDAGPRSPALSPLLAWTSSRRSPSTPFAPFAGVVRRFSANPAQRARVRRSAARRACFDRRRPTRAGSGATRARPEDLSDLYTI
ncbi:hypothetical protein, partial [Burkholderia thailandensis]